MPPLSYTWNLRPGIAKVNAGRAMVVDEVDARHTVLRAEQAVLGRAPPIGRCPYRPAPPPRCPRDRRLRRSYQVGIAAF